MFAIKESFELKSRYKERVQVATEYAKMIDDFDDLVDLQSLAHHFLGLEPSPFILHAIEIEEKSEICFEFFPLFIYLFFMYLLFVMQR